MSISRRALQPIVDRLAGKGAGLREAEEKLRRDPCDAGGYKLLGPLRDRACGLHMRRDYRLAFTLVPDADDEEGLGRPVVAVLMIGRKHRGRRAGLPATFELLHDILGEGYVGGSLDRTPCCENGPPSMDEADIDDAMRVLRKLLRDL